MSNLSIAYILRLRDEFSSVSGKINNSMKGLEDKFSAFNGILSQTGTDLKNTGKAAFAGLTVPILAGGGLAVKSFHDMESATAKLESSLKSTGGIAGVTMDQMLDKANELQSKTLFGNDKILNDVTSRLLTFTGITEDNFMQAHDVILDVASKLGTDLSGAAQQVGRALNDPSVGMSLLSRAGITLSDDTKELILALHELGFTSEAQTLIFDELAVAFDGSAEAMANAGLGPFIQQWNDLTDALKPIGRIIVEIMEKAIPKIREAISTFDGLSDSNKRLIVIIGGVLAALGPMLITAGALILGISRVSGVVVGLIKVLRILTVASPFGLMLTGIALAIGGLVLLVKNFDKVTAGVKKAWEWVKNLFDRFMSFESDNIIVKALVFPIQSAIDLIQKFSGGVKKVGKFLGIGERFKTSPVVTNADRQAASVQRTDITARSVTDVNLNISDPGKLVSNTFTKSRGLTNVNLGTNMQGAA